jgi:hypothetical protein
VDWRLVVFLTGLQDFSGLTGLGFNHDNPEKSCNTA